MKKRRIISLILCVAMAALCLISCSDYGAPNHNTDSPTYAVSQTNLASELSSFMSENINRTTYTEGEKKAAEYLFNRLMEMGYGDVGLQDFTVTENGVSGLKSQNVVASIGSDDKSAKNVIIGAYYDNRYSEAYSGATPDGGEGAAAGGTGVAALLGVADYLVNHRSEISRDVRVNIVFFGASYATNDGGSAYLDRLKENEYKNTVLMIEMQRLCGDHIYAFSDARETKREKFFDGIAADNGLDIYKPTSKSPLILGLSALSGVPYYQWAHGGVFSEFFNAGIPTLNLVGGNWDSANLSDIESTENDNISYSENDTLYNLKRFYPDYAEKMATAATLVIRSVCNRELTDVMQYDRDNFPNTDALASGWIWQLVVLAVIIIAAVGMYAVTARLKKKYPIERKAPPQMKMAVFGMDYEDKSSADIFIDIKSGSDEIFPGVSNNAPKADDPIDEIFPPLGGQSDGDNSDGGKQDGEDGHSDDPFNDR